MFDLFTRGSPGSILAHRKFKYQAPPKPWVGLDRYEARLPLPTLDAEIVSRLTKAPDMSPELFKGGSVGRVVLPTVGTAIRLIKPGRRAIGTGAHTSKKMRRGLKFEERYEHRFFQYCEVDTGVVAFRPQPFRFEFVIDGRRHAWIPDVARQLINGAIEVIEIKSSLSAVRDKSYILKLNRASELCAVLGWSFRLVEGKYLLETDIFNFNVTEIVGHRHVPLSLAEIYLVLTEIEQAGGSVAYGSLLRYFQGHKVGDGKLAAMMCRRIIDIDLTRPISEWTAVRAVPALPIAGGF